MGVRRGPKKTAHLREPPPLQRLTVKPAVNVSELASTLESVSAKPFLISPMKKPFFRLKRANTSHKLFNGRQSPKMSENCID